MEVYKINQIIDELTKKSGLVHSKFIQYNGQINYLSLYQYGLILTDLLQKKHKEEGIKGSIDEDKLPPNDLEKAEKYFKDTFDDINTKLNDINRDHLIRLKYLFEMIEKYRALNTVNVNDALWGIAISLADFLITENIQQDEIIKYKEKLINERPFNDIKEFDENWMKGIGNLINFNVKGFGPDYRRLAGDLKKNSNEYKDFQTLCLGIDVIANTHIHAVRCPRAVQGAMMTSIEHFGDSDKKTMALQNLGKITKEKPKTSSENLGPYPTDDKKANLFWKKYFPDINDYNKYNNVSSVFKGKSANYPNSFWLTATNAKLCRKWYVIGTDYERKTSKIFCIEAGTFTVEQFGINKNERNRKRPESGLSGKFEACIDADNYVDQIKKEADFSDCLYAIADFDKGEIEWFNKDN